MTTKANTLRPGLLVSLKTSVAGNVSYDKKPIEVEHIVDTGAQKTRWETERTIIDPVEHEAAKVARSKAAGLIRRVCAVSAFGLLCPEVASPDLDAAVAEARRVVDEFNAGAKLSRISVYVITGRIVPDDVEAVKAINSEVRDLLSDMADGIKNLDVKVIREAATKAKNLGSMLSPDAGARIQIAIEAARTAARRIVQAGEQGAAMIDTFSLRKITESRTAFLDLDPVNDVAVPATEGRALDLSPILPVEAAAQKFQALEVE